MKRGITIIIMGCAIAMMLGLAACGEQPQGGTDPGAPAASAPSATSNAPATSAPSQTDATPSAPAATTASPQNAKLESLYESKAREMESTVNDYSAALKRDAESLAAIPEAANMMLDDDLKFMRKNIGEIRDSAIKWFEESGEPEADVKAYSDRITKLADESIATLEQTADGLRL